MYVSLCSYLHHSRIRLWANTHHMYYRIMERILEDHQVKHFVWKGAYMMLYSFLSKCILKATSNGKSTMALGDFCSDWLFVFKTCLSYAKMRPCLVQLLPIASCLLYVALSEKRASIFSSVLWWGPFWVFSFLGRRHLTPTVFPHRASSLALWSSSWPSFGPSSAWLYHCGTVGTRIWGAAWQVLSRMGWSHLYVC